tara:strand:- start:1729 stop:3183 length:1455 start_codon:yes stop_codon:yes gene_type:complete
MANLTDYSINDSPMMMDIRSDTLEPISNTSRKYVFRLDQAGYLDQNSVLLFKLQNVAANSNLRVNNFNGGLGAIKRAIFQVGDFVINDVDGCDKMMTMMNFVSKNNTRRNNYDCWYYQNQMNFKVLEAASVGATGGDNCGTGTIVADRTNCGVNIGQVNNGNAATEINSMPITNNHANNTQIGIPLGTIFPALKGRTIPLFLFQDYRILITIEFNDAPKYINDIAEIAGGAGGNTGLRANPSAITYQDVKLQVDYIIMPSEVQNKDRAMTNAQGGLNLTFFDSVKVEKQIAATTANTLQSVEHRIGADNKEVHKIYMTKRLTADDGLPHNAHFLDQRIDGMNQEEYNVNIAGVDIFPDYKWSPASQYDETANCLGADIQVPRPVYFNDENTAFNGVGSQSGGLLGKYKPLCLDLSNGNDGILGSGRTIGAYPIIWKYRRKPVGAVAGYYTRGLNTALEVDYYLLVSKTANIKSSPQGTQVMVSY